MFPRHIKLPESQSFFLFGARGVGKSTLLQELLPAADTFFISLLLAKK